MGMTLNRRARCLQDRVDSEYDQLNFVSGRGICRVKVRDWQLFM
jgi:hypothetical protein